MRLKKNDKAFDFDKKDYLDNSVRLSDYRGKKVLLSFFRGATCPFCNLRIHELIKNHSKFEENNIVVITFFAATNDEIIKYAGKQKAPFAIIADGKEELYKEYKIEESSSGMLKTMLNPLRMIKVMKSGFFNLNSTKEKPIVPADFLIDEDQKIYRVHYGKHFGDHLQIEDILMWKNGKN